MTFYTDKWTIAKINLENMILVRKSNDNILLERIVGDTSINSKELLAKDILEEYDLAIDPPNNIYLIYQNREMHLILNVIRDRKKEEIRLTSDPISEVFNLNIIVKGKDVHIIYLIKLEDERGKYRILHHYYDGNAWDTYIVEDITSNKVLNPIKLIEIEGNLLLSYYSNDTEIKLKEFNLDKLEWSNEIKLVATPSDKLFLDLLKIEDLIHLSYCEFIDGNLVIKYERLLYSDGNLIKYNEESISNEGTPSYPTIILFENKLWITWVELNKIMSRYSEDKGNSWGPIYMWNNSKNIDFVRYKYLSMVPEKNILLNNSFGKTYPEVVFMGFGPTDKAVEIPLKKNKTMRYLRI